MTIDEKEFLELLNSNATLCPRCLSNVVTPHTVSAGYGVCATCYKRALIEEKEQQKIRLELALKDAAVRKAVQRDRERLVELLGGKRVLRRLLGCGDIERCMMNCLKSKKERGENDR